VTAEATNLLDIQNLKVRFKTLDGEVTAVDGVDLDVRPGETVGLVGESGCGKSVTALSILKLLPKRASTIEGRIWFEGRDLVQADQETMLGIRGASIGMIFQEPMTSLNPIMTVGRQLKEAITAHERTSDETALSRAVKMLKQVQIPAPAARAREYPFALSGGMRQRAMIAMALSCRPKLLLADEPTTALDVTIQAQILELMKDIKRDTGASIVLITHDLGLIAEMASRVVVMYAGLVVEEAGVRDLFADPRHPYTQGLLGSIPALGRKFKEGRTRLREISGVVPSLTEMPAGCRFNPRCGEAFDRCRTEPPPMIDLGGRRKARCWLQA
jgi:oligopeptide/dipeptide ABC transporter ATP-binding protein